MLLLEKLQEPGSAEWHQVRPSPSAPLAPLSPFSLGALPGHATEYHPLSHPQGATAALPNCQDGLGGPSPADHSPGDFHLRVSGGEGVLWLLGAWGWMQGTADSQASLSALLPDGSQLFMLPPLWPASSDPHPQASALARPQCLRLSLPFGVFPSLTLPLPCPSQLRKAPVLQTDRAGCPWPSSKPL